MSIGEERKSHIILPSSDMPGKTKRARDGSHDEARKPEVQEGDDV